MHKDIEQEKLHSLKLVECLIEKMFALLLDKWSKRLSIKIIVNIYLETPDFTGNLPLTDMC